MSGDFLTALYFSSLLLSTAIKEILSLCTLFRNLKTEALFATTVSTLERIRSKIKAQRQNIVVFFRQRAIIRSRLTLLADVFYLAASFS